MTTETKPKPKTRTAKPKTDTTEKKESGRSATQHLAEALQMIGSAILFKSEGERVRFHDHLTLAGGNASPDAKKVATDRIKAHDEAQKETA